MDYKLKLGVITSGRQLAVDNPTEFQPKSSNYFQVRVMPDMADIEDIDPISGNLMLPWYPNFFGDCNNAYQKDDVVWIACEENFRVGFIIGYAQSSAGTDISSMIQVLNQAEALGGYDQSSVNTLTIQSLADNCITSVDKDSGRVSQVYNSRVVFIYNKDGSMFSTNGTSYVVTIDPAGNINYKCKSKTEEVDGDITLKGGRVSENLTSKSISTVNRYSINSGGAYQMTAAGNASNNVVGSSTTIAGLKISNMAGTKISNTVAAGGIFDTVGAGVISMTVAAGAVNILAPLISMEALSINLIGVVSIVGALNLLACPFVMLPISVAGFAIVGVPFVITPLLIGI